MDGLSAVSLNMGFVHVSTSAHLYLTEKFLQSLYGGGVGLLSMHQPHENTLMTFKYVP
jgi:hypothetical protein